MDIDGLGEKQALRFLEEGLIADVGDIYDLDEERLTGLEGFGEVSARNLVAAIEASRERPFQRVLYALGLPGVGYVTAEALAMHFGSIDELQRADPEQIEEVEGVGPVMAVQIAESLADERTAELIAKLGEKGLRLELDASERRQAGGPLEGKTLVLTGTLARADPRGGRGADQGGGRQGRPTRSRRRPTTWSPATTPGSKLAKAEKLGDRDPRRGRPARARGLRLSAAPRGRRRRRRSGPARSGRSRGCRRCPSGSRRRSRGRWR